MITKIIVTAFGVVLIILVNWFFLFSRKKTSAAVRIKSEFKEGPGENSS